MKTNTHNVGENPEKQSFKKSYLKRITEEKEDLKEIERCINYENDWQESWPPSDGNPNRPT